MAIWLNDLRMSNCLNCDAYRTCLFLYREVVLYARFAYLWLVTLVGGYAKHITSPIARSPTLPKSDDSVILSFPPSYGPSESL